MKQPTIFFASSTPAIPIAAALAYKMSNPTNATVKCRLWWDVIQAGKNTLEALIDECKRADFAIVVLTADDVLVNVANRTVAIGPRDNCVFEAGLFMGALGANPERCFIVVDSIIEQDLLSDIRGLTFLPLNVPNEFYEPYRIAQLKDLKKEAKKPENIVLPDTLNESLENVVIDINKAIQDRDLYTKLVQDHRLPYVSKDMLIASEMLIDQGDLVQSDYVLVMAKEPLELKPQVAYQVMQNMRGEVNYQYIFHADKQLVERYARLVQLMVTDGVQGNNKKELISNMGNANAQATVEANLDVMKEYLRIYFLPYVPGIELCIHNAQDPQKAECYLRVPGTEEKEAKFVAWCNGILARGIREQMLAGVENQDKIVVFTTTGDPSKPPPLEAPLKKALRGLIHKDFQDKIEKACFG